MTITLEKNATSGRRKGRKDCPSWCDGHHASDSPDSWQHRGSVGDTYSGNVLLVVFVVTDVAVGGSGGFHVYGPYVVLQAYGTDVRGRVPQVDMHTAQRARDLASVFEATGSGELAEILRQAADLINGGAR